MKQLWLSLFVYCTNKLTIFSRYLSKSPTVASGSIFKVRPVLSIRELSPGARSNWNLSRLANTCKQTKWFRAEQLSTYFSFITDGSFKVRLLELRHLSLSDGISLLNVQNSDCNMQKAARVEHSKLFMLIWRHSSSHWSDSTVTFFSRWHPHMFTVTY